MSKDKFKMTPETTLREYGIGNDHILDSNEFVSAVSTGDGRVELAVNCEPHFLVHVAAKLTTKVMIDGNLEALTYELECMIKD